MVHYFDIDSINVLIIFYRLFDDKIAPTLLVIEYYMMSNTHRLINLQNPICHFRKWKTLVPSLG